MKQVLTLLSLASLLFIGDLHAQDLSWQELNTPKNFPVLCLKSFNNQLYAGYGGLGLLRSKDAGVTWDTLNKGLEDLYIRDLISPSAKELYAAAHIDGVYYSSNEGASWIPFNKGIDASLTFCLLQKDNQLFAGTSQGIYAANPKEGIWRRLVLPKTSAVNQMITCLYQSGNTIYAGSSQSIYLSEDDGKNWREIPKVTKYMVTAITEYKGRLLIATSGNGIVETDLRANALSKSPEFLGEDTVMTVNAMFVTAEGLLLKGTNRKGIFQTDSTLNRGLLDYDIRTIVEHKNQFYAGTVRQGVVIFKDKAKLYPAELAKAQTGATLQMELSPNPANQRVSINFSLLGEATQALSCVLLSAEGRVVKNLVRRESYQPGQYTLEADLQRLAAGVYYCRISNSEGTLSITRQLLVNK